ncbi:MAG: trigger factor [Candidatus Berkelbacteria bacterium]|nr:trigger factor [Candidatus Berkelbacteria bacterium]MCR4307431.1 trigger factor [Candidatus Berkelbacteria bacterium]
MEIKQRELPNSRLQFTVDLTVDEVTKHFEQALARLANSVKLPGFRPGKAPANLVKEQIDQTKLREEAYGLAVQSAWREAVKNLKELPIQDPEVELGDFEEGKMTKLTFEFDVRPEVKVGSWQKIKLGKTKEEEVSDAEVGELIDSLRRAHAKTIAKLTPAASGDKVHVNFSGSLGGVRQDKLSSKEFPLIIGQANTIPGFDEQVLGLKKGDTKKFSLTFPKDHFDKTLATKLVDFEAEVTEVFDVILPELNDEFAKGFGHTKAEQLRKAIKEDIGTRKSDEQFINQKARWLAQFEKLVNCDLPESLLVAEVERSRGAWRAFLQERHINEGEWLKTREITLEQLEKDWHKAAEASVKIGLGLAEVAKSLKKELKSNEEFQQLLDDLVKQAIQ